MTFVRGSCKKNELNDELNHLSLQQRQEKVMKENDLSEEAEYKTKCKQLIKHLKEKNQRIEQLQGELQRTKGTN